jgi:hypothetical protein
MMFMRFAIDCVFVGRPSVRDGDRPVYASAARACPWTGVVWLVHGARRAGVVGAIDASRPVDDLVRLGPTE